MNKEGVVHLAVLQQAHLSPTTPWLALVNNDKPITNGLVKADVETG